MLQTLKKNLNISKSPAGIFYRNRLPSRNTRTIQTWYRMHCSMCPQSESDLHLKIIFLNRDHQTSTRNQPYTPPCFWKQRDPEPLTTGRQEDHAAWKQDIHRSSLPIQHPSNGPSVHQSVSPLKVLRSPGAQCCRSAAAPHSSSPAVLIRSPVNLAPISSNSKS